MKRAVLLMFVFCSSLAFAQNSTVESTYEKDGGLVAVTTYHEDGSVKETGFYKNKKLHGEWAKFNQEGVKVARAYYTNGKKTGKWMFLNNGVLTEVDYDNNKITNVYEWNNNDNVVIN